MSPTRPVLPIRNRHTFIVVACLALAAVSCARPLARDDVTAERLAARVSYLASDALAGRMTGTPGEAAAEEYVAAAFREGGLAPAPGRNGYFLDFPIYEYGFDRQAVKLSLKSGDRLWRGVMGTDFVPLPASAEGLALGEIVFAGYGISAPEAGYDDYAGLSARGKIVLAFRHEPSRLNVAGRSGKLQDSPRAYFSVKTKTAARRGARAVLFVNDPGSGADEEGDLATESRMSLSAERPYNDVFPRDDELRPFDIPAFRISVPFASRLFAAAGLSPPAVQEALDRGRKPAEFPLPGASALLFCRRYLPPRAVKARNVAGFVRGSDPALADKWIVVGAHHDHIGSFAGARDSIFNGADDNASGTSGVIELARVLAARQPRLRHSLLFLTFSGEEEGLLGSEVVFQDNLLPPNKMAYMINLDMIGRNPSQVFQILTRRRDDKLTEAVRQFIAPKPLRAELFYKPKEVYSDDYPFAQHDVPTFFFFAGLHDDYHGVDDEADRIDYPAMEARVRYVYDFIVFLDGQ